MVGVPDVAFEAAVVDAGDVIALDEGIPVAVVDNVGAAGFASKC